MHFKFIVLFFAGLLSGPVHAGIQVPPDSGAAPSEFCHVTDGMFTECAGGGAEWSDITPMFFADSNSYLYADQADLDPSLGIPGSNLDTFMLMYDQCERTSPLGEDEYVLVTFDTVEGVNGTEHLERYVIHIFDDGTIVFFENGELELGPGGNSRVAEIEGQSGDAGFGPSPNCAFDHVQAEFQIKLSATNIVVNGSYSPDPLWWSSDVPEEPEIPCPEPGSTTMVTLQPVTAQVQLALKPYQIQYGELPLEFTSVGEQGGSACTVTSNAGSLPVMLDLFRDAPPAPFQIAESTATASIDFFEAGNGNAGGAPQCNFDGISTGCFLNSPGDESSNVARWTTDGFKETVFDVPITDTGPLEFFVNLDDFNSESFGDLLQNVEQFVHETLIDNLSGIDSLGLIQDPPASLLLTSATGRRTGVTPGGIIVSEIPRSGYFEFPEVTVVVLVDPDEGTYFVDVIAPPTDPFSLSMSFANFLGNTQLPFVSEEEVNGTIESVGSSFEFTVTPGTSAPGLGAVRAGFNSSVLPANDDGSTGTVPIGFDIDFLGDSFASLFINNNGNVTFDFPLSAFTPFNLTSTARVIIAPFFGDVDTRTGNVVTYGTGLVLGKAAFGVNWPDVGCYNQNTSVLNNFQLMLIDRNDIAPGDFDIEFNYDSIQWETGQFSGGNAVCQGPNSARVGYSNGTGAPGTFFELEGSGVSGAFLNNNVATGLVNNNLNDPQLGRYVLSVRNGTPVTERDRDGDGIIDALDNCPRISNAGQQDTDLNGIGDACQSPEELHSTAGLIQAFLDGTSAGWPFPLSIDSEATLIHRVAHIVEFRVRVGFTTDAAALTRNLVNSLVESGLVDPADVDEFVEAVLDTLVSADAGPDQAAVECTGPQPGHAPVTLDGSGSTDLSGGTLTYSWVPGMRGGAIINPILPLGMHTFELTVDSNKGGTDTDTVDVTVVDTKPPIATAALVPINVRHNRGTFEVNFNCDDECDNGNASATLNGIRVKNGQVLKLKVKSVKSKKSGKSGKSKRSGKSERSRKNRVLTIEGPSFELSVVCEDAQGNKATSTATAEFAQRSKNSEKSEKSKKSKKG